MLGYPIDPEKVPEQVRQIIAILDQEGFETWMVGGCVRDLCLGLKPKDFDLATSARPDQVQQVFSHHYATGLQHGTITVIWRELAVEITTFRSEGNYTDSRRPDLVIFHDQIDADLARRDFTMNSMAWRPDRGLLDMHGGLQDLHKGILRSVGDARSRFDEDALRLLRAVRFAVTYDLTPAPEMIAAAAELPDRLDRLSRERITAEMLRILAAPYPRQLLAFSGCGLLSAAARIMLLQHRDDERLCSRLSQLIQPEMPQEQRLPLFYLAAAAGTMSFNELRQILIPAFKTSAGHHLQHLLMHECRVSRQQAQAGEAIIYLLMLRLLLPLDRPLAPANQRRLLRLLARRCHLATAELGPIVEAVNNFLLILQPYADPQMDIALLQFAPTGKNPPPLTLADMPLNGRQLQAAGWPAGPVLRIAMERVLSCVIQSPELNNLTSLMALANTIPRSKVQYDQKMK